MLHRFDLRCPCSTSSPRFRDAGLARRTLVIGVAAALAVGGTTAALMSSNDGSTNAISSPLQAITGQTPTPAPVPTLLSLKGHGGKTVPWSKPLTLSVRSGTLKSVIARGPDGDVKGNLTPTRWTSSATLIPSSRYVLHADYTDANGKDQSIDRAVVSSKPNVVLHADFSRLGKVGIGEPLIVRFDHAVKGAAARAAVMKRLQVITTPAVEGAWRFYNSYEAHYRPATYWAPGTTVEARADLSELNLPGSGTWGSDTVSTGGMRIGDALVSTVDITAHMMTVQKNGRVLRTVKVSTGRDKYPTKGGVHIILTVERVQLYNSATVGIPTASPDGYYEKLPYSMRISNGGAFVHANPATVSVQGRLNVSHGCVNLSVPDAKWFYGISTRGDVVNVVHAVVQPVLSDAGMSDWNYPWATWRQGNLNG